MTQVLHDRRSLLGHDSPIGREALAIARQIDDRVGQSYLLAELGCHAARSGQARLAATLPGAAETIRTEAGARAMPGIAR